MFEKEDIQHYIEKINSNKFNYLFGASLLLAIWFLFTSAKWSDFANITLSYPFGMVALVLSIAGVILDHEKKKYTIIHLTLAIGVLWAILVLMLM